MANDREQDHEREAYLSADGSAQPVSAPSEGVKAIEWAIDQLQAHEHEERDLLDEYRYAAHLGPDEGVRFLMGLILEDEQRHHRLMAAMTEDARAAALPQSGATLPRIQAAAEDRERLLRQTRRFIEVEQENARGLEELKAAIRQPRAGLSQVILEGMELDTRKHIGILRYILQQLEAAGQPV
jgi:hypothetical protein